MTPASLLQLMWLASPALPVGGFSYSEGLEAAIDSGQVSDEATAGDWLQHQLQLGLARSELPLVAAAFTAWQAADGERIGQLNRWVLSTRESSELRQQTEQMGRSLLVWLRLREGDDPRLALLEALKPAPAWPVAFALALAQSAAPLADSLHCFAFGWAENMVQAAIKAVPLGQNAGQRMLARLMQDIPAACEQAIARAAADERQAFSPMLAILSAQHETQYSRLFRS
jgi:urease accessory protein